MRNTRTLLSTLLSSVAACTGPALAAAAPHSLAVLREWGNSQEERKIKAVGWLSPLYIQCTYISKSSSSLAVIRTQG